MESFNKRQKEQRRLERQRDKAAKRKEIKARKVAELASDSARDVDANTAAAGEPAADPATTG